MRTAHLCLSTTLSVALLGGTAFADSAGSTGPSTTDIRSLDGSGNNTSKPAWGQAGTNYLRIAHPAYADGIAKPEPGPIARYVSNRIFNDLGQNVFSENGVSQWGWAWAQFIDHDMGLRDETPGEPMANPFDPNDPLEGFHSDQRDLGFNRTPAAPGTGRGATARQQVNTVSSYLDGSQVYGTTPQRLAWLRDGAHLLMPGGFLPRADARGGAAPPMDLFGAQAGDPGAAVVAGDVRANENAALTAIQTLFAREHNRIVDQLPTNLSDDDKFQIARRIVGAEIQYVTYNEFLPAMGVRLAAYRGYKPWVQASLSNEFAATGFRGHSMVHGEFETVVPAAALTPARVADLQQQGVEVVAQGATFALTIPLAAAFGNPSLVRTIGLGPLLNSLSEREYKNDEQIDNAMRSVLFEAPTGNDPTACAEPTQTPDCFTGVSDLGADDVLRGRDHGIPNYNDLRRAYGLSPASSFRDMTGEPTDRMPRGISINDPRSLDFVQLTDAHGNVIPLGSPDAQEDAVNAVRRSTTAARLRAIYGDVDSVDAFVGMISEPHLPHSELGALQNAIWVKQFTALRDGDRFFYANDPQLGRILRRYGIDYRRTLAQIMTDDAGSAPSADLFHVPAQP